MAKKELLGHIGPCVCCSFADMEVRGDKNGNPYAYCPDCSAQVLTHGRPERVRPMLARMRPVSLTEAKPDAKAQAAAPVPEAAKATPQAAPEPKRAPKAAEPKAKPAPQAAPVKPELKAPAKRSPWAPILDSAAS